MTRLAVVRGIVVLAVSLAVGGCGSAEAPNDDRSEASSHAGTTTPTPDQIAELREAANLAPCPRADGEPSSASDLPELDLACLDGGPDVAVAGLVGTPYVVNFWASWCTECVEEVPYLQQVADESAGRVQVLGVNYLDDEEAALLAAPEFGLRFASLFDPDGSLGETFRFDGLPYTFFVDAAGVVVGKHPGAFKSADDLRAAIEDELGVRL